MSDGSLIFDTKIDKEGMKSGVEDIRKNLQKAQNQMVKEFEKTQNAMKKTEAEIDKVSSSLDKMYQEAKSQYAGLPNNQKLIDAELAKNKEYQKSIQKVEELNSQYTQQEKQCNILKNNIGALAEEQKKLNNVQDKAKSNISKNTEHFRSQVKETNTLGKAIKSLTRKFRLLIVAMIIRGAINAVKDGFNDLAKYSKEFNGTMSQLQGTFLQARNSIATAFAPVLQALTPIIVTVTNGIIGLMNAIAQMNAVIFKNSSTFTRAKKVTTDYAKSLGNASKKAYKSLASFDEINQLTSKNDGSSGTPEASQMFEEANVDSGMTSFFDEIKNKIQMMKKSLAEWLSQFSIPFSNWFNVDVEGLKTAFIGLITNVFSTGFENVKTIFLDFAQNILPTLINTLFNFILPFFTQLLTQIIATLSVLFTTLSTLFMKVYTEGISPALQLMAKIWESVWGTIYSNWQKWGEPIFNNLRTAIENMSETWSNIWDNILRPVWNNFMETVDWLWTNHLQPLLDNFLDFVGTLVNGALDIYNGFILPVVNWFVDTFGEGIVNTVNTVVNTLGTVIGTVADVASGIITSLKGIIEYIVGIFTGDWERAWEGIKTFYEGLWDGIVGIVKGAINLVIDFVNGMIEAVRTGINKVIGALNQMSFTVPDWVPGFGGDEWGFSIPLVPEFKIPKLATGTVVPANYGNFLAMLGDNKRETEVVSPLSTMKQALIEALQEHGGQNITIGFEETSIGDWVRMLKPYIDKENRRVGNSMRLRGAY